MRARVSDADNQRKEIKSELRTSVAIAKKVSVQLGKIGSHRRLTVEPFL